MSGTVTWIRRVLFLIAIGAAGGAVVAWWRERSGPGSPPSTPEWRPIATGDTATDTSGAAADVVPPGPIGRSPGVPAAGDGDGGEPAGGVGRSPGMPSGPEVVNALVDATDARSATSDGGWVAPNEDGSCPDGYPVKANDNSGIFHVPGGRFYDRTVPERCYATPEGAEADGYRAAKS